MHATFCFRIRESEGRVQGAGCSVAGWQPHRVRRDFRQGNTRKPPSALGNNELISPSPQASAQSDKVVLMESNSDSR